VSFVQVVGAADGDAGEKSTERDGKAECLREGCGSKTDGDGDQQENLWVLGAARAEEAVEPPLSRGMQGELGAELLCRASRRFSGDGLRRGR